jgi:hypothetical protein
MRYVLLCISLLTVIILISFAGCRREESKAGIAPVIQFITDSGFIYTDTVLKTGTQFKIGIICKGISNKITCFNYRLTTEHGINSVDSGMNTPGFSWETILTKGSSKTEIWSFFVRDRESNSSDTIRLIISLDSNSVYGKIIDMPEIILGAQSSTVYPGFYSLITRQTYDDLKAYQNQSLIDLLYYFDPVSGDNHTLASPGANIDSTLFTKPWPLQNWTIKNTTRFEYSSVNPAEFNASKNDSLILANTFTYASGKRKAKNLASGNVYSFVSQNGKKGLFKVNDVNGTDSGYIKLSLKIQAQ